MRRSSLLLAAFGATFLAGATAHAYDSLAAPCSVNPLYCERGAIAFDKTDALPIQFDFDTGWIPQNSPLQVHVFAAVYANTHVALAGALETSWPKALVLKTPGDGEGGLLGFHYGVET